jgi:hypothetical protein
MSVTFANWELMVDFPSLSPSSVPDSFLLPNGPGESSSSPWPHELQQAVGSLVTSLSVLVI